MKIAITGSSGFIGSAVSFFLSTEGHQLVKLVRHSPRAGKSEVYWDPVTGNLDLAGLREIDAVIHLAGENISEGHWTDRKKTAIRVSRVKGTRFLCHELARLARPPKVFICASAVGYYGNRGNEVLVEESCQGEGFLADVCREWENASEPALRRGIRVVNMRLGIVLSRDGGILSKMLPAFKLGVGGMLGSGNQYMSWIAMDDLFGALSHALNKSELQGPVNLVSPNPVTNRQFTDMLGKVVGCLPLFPIPTWGLRLAFGDMANELLLSSARVRPAKLISNNYIFRYPQLEQALEKILK